MLKNFNKRHYGFTLIELLVVIAIIGLLASVIWVYLASPKAKGRDTERMSEVKEINTAMEMCYVDPACGGGENNYPIFAAGTHDGEAIGTYLTVPSDPLSTDYGYIWVADCTAQKYCAYAELEAPDNTTYFCASNAGTAKKEYAGPPDIIDCCGLTP